MVVFLLERVPTSLRGELTRWLLEPRAGVFVGNVSAMVRDKLWEKACENAKGGACSLMWSSNTEQGFLVESYGDTSRKVRNWEGLLLVTKPKKA
jgi:CRISPR-associated protein Cas2